MPLDVENVHRSQAFAVVVWVGAVPPVQRIHSGETAAQVIVPAVPEVGLHTSKRRTDPGVDEARVTVIAPVPILNVCEVEVEK